MNKCLQKQFSSFLSVTIDQKLPVEREHDIRKIYRASEGTESAYFTSHVKYDDSRMLEVIAKRENVDSVISALHEFQVRLYVNIGSSLSSLLQSDNFTVFSFVIDQNPTGVKRQELTPMHKVRFEALAKLGDSQGYHDLSCYSDTF